ncbi:MAG: GspH/FimT family pseudopilin [Pseudomonas sp.]
MRIFTFTRANGFTLLEGLTVTAITAVLLSLGAPAFTHFHTQNLRSSAAQQLVSLFALARSTAVKTAKPVTFCASPDGNSCGRNTARFFLVFIDKNSNLHAEPDELIRKEAPSSTKVLYQFTTSTLNSFRFRANGTASSYGNVVICPANRDNHYGSKLIINNTGRVRRGRDIDGDQIVDGSNGAPLLCPS